MTDLAGDAPAETLSTTIDAEPSGTASGGGVPKIVEDKPEPSLRDTIADEVKKEAEAREDGKPDADAEADAKEPKAEEPKEEKAKTERAPDGKFAAKDKSEAAPSEKSTDASPAPANDAADKADAKHYPEPPKNFLPDSKEMWRNVPRPVRRDIEVMTREHAAEIERSREVAERYEPVRRFDEVARSNGRNLGESLQRVVEIETALQSNPIFGLNKILQEIGPRKGDGQAYSIYEVAEHIVAQGPQAFQQSMQQVQRSQPQPEDPRIAEMQQELANTKAEMIRTSVVEPFMRDRPRYTELEDSIASVLRSGMIPASLSAPERLEAAYVMAERLNPPSAPALQPDPAPAPESRAADSLNGQKSIRSAPGAVSSDMEPERGGSIRDILRDEARRMGRSQ
ncbi:MAG: hypothetical protein EON59_08010 [Alphaproteobacteria bacterium]|nr:MAG: hypothetical protein EON59_08010 [Alphaproteobacteria bacterium]